MKKTDVTMTVDGQLIGTSAYMSPGQAKGEGHHADRRGDIYSLGVILYVMLAGDLPFRGHRQLLCLKIIRDPPPPPRSVNQRNSQFAMLNLLGIFAAVGFVLHVAALFVLPDEFL